MTEDTKLLKDTAILLGYTKSNTNVSEISQVFRISKAKAEIVFKSLK